jgi:AraC-like DNA-binding protein
MDNSKILNQQFFFKYLNYTENSDLDVIEYAYEQCSSDKPPVLSNKISRYTLHYILSGKGCVEINEKKYCLNCNTIFFITPNDKYKYYPDPKNPWKYVWISFYGSKAKFIFQQMGFTLEYPFYNIKNPNDIINTFTELISINEENEDINFMALSYLYNIFSNIVVDRGLHKYTPYINNKQKYINYVIKFIENNYFSDFANLKTISEQIHINSIYLNRIFLETIGVPIYKYITMFRIQKAANLLEKDHTINETAVLVGYQDPKYFSRIFRKYKNISPSKYKELYLSKNNP